MIKVSPSILSADFSNVRASVKMIEKADMVHLDVMDGRFVPNITFGMKFVSDLKKCTHLPLDVHLMILEPQKYVQRFIDAGANYVTLHLEALPEPTECLRAIKAKGVRAGLAISPDTPVSDIMPFIGECDLLLLMSVYPGFSGQKFIEKSLDRLAQLKALRDKLNPHAVIQMDGGITIDNVASVAGAGVDIIVAGNTVFCAPDPEEAIAKLKIRAL